MKTFSAQAFDLDLELTMLNGETVELKPKELPSAGNVERILMLWRKLEEVFKDTEIQFDIATKKREEDIKNGKKVESIGDSNKLTFDLVAARLSIVYDKPKDWFMNNFHIDTLNKITEYISMEMTGFKKKSLNSTRSKN